MEEPDFRKMEITVVGLGLVGGSIAMGLKKLNPKKIWAVDIDENVLEAAKQIKVIDGGFTTGLCPLANSDLVIICVHPGKVLGFIRENMHNFKQGAVITDISGLKKRVVAEIKLLLREDLDFVGGHPLAGREGSGFSQASDRIFEGANYILTPVEGNGRKSIELVERMIRGLGCKTAIYMDPDEHDQVIALTSHLPHVIAAALMNSTALTNAGNLIGGSFRDATRVAEMNVDLWNELLLANKENVLTQIDIFADNISKIKLALQTENSAALREMLQKASEKRERF